MQKVRKNLLRLRIPLLKIRVEDSNFPRKMRLKAEAIFVERKNKGGSVLYEFVDYKGLYSL